MNGDVGRHVAACTHSRIIFLKGYPDDGSRSDGSSARDGRSSAPAATLSGHFGLTGGCIATGCGFGTLISSRIGVGPARTAPSKGLRPLQIVQARRLVREPRAHRREIAGVVHPSHRQRQNHATSLLPSSGYPIFFKTSCAERQDEVVVVQWIYEICRPLNRWHWQLKALYFV